MRKYRLVLFAALLCLALTGCTLRPEPAPTPEPTPALVAPAPPPTPMPTPDPAPAPTPTSTPTPEPTPEPTPYRPDIDVTSWEYILANAWNEIGEYAPELTTVEGHQFDARAADALSAFLQGARDAGLSVTVNSAYRDYATQKYLYERKVAQYGEETAKTIVLPPGTSEHQTGLSADIADRFYETKDSSLENTATFRWMQEHCAEYGFILRYPKDKEDVTGVIYEPWHFRYVGPEAAAFIKEEGLCLEEFLALYAL